MKNRRWTLSEEERFWSKVEITPYGCWEWCGCLTKGGYGQFVLGTRVYAHRYAYKMMVGEIPEGLQVDHLCRNRSCVNPEHMEIVTRKENILRGQSLPAKCSRLTHCPRGHEYNEQNTYLWIGKEGTKNSGKVGRQCRICAKQKYSERKQKKASDE